MNLLKLCPPPFIPIKTGRRKRGRERKESRPPCPRRMEQLRFRFYWFPFCVYWNGYWSQVVFLTHSSHLPIHPYTYKYTLKTAFVAGFDAAFSAIINALKEISSRGCSLKWFMLGMRIDNGWNLPCVIWMMRAVAILGLNRKRHVCLPILEQGIESIKQILPSLLIPSRRKLQLVYLKSA